MTRGRLLIGTAATIAAIVAICWALALWLERGLDDIPRPDVGSRVSLWAHRGFGEPANTAESVVAAARAGYAGVEIDVRWYGELGLRVGHDRVESAAAAALPTLDEVLAASPDRRGYWIDLKGLTPDNADRIADALLAALPRPEIGSRLWIESHELGALARLRDHITGIIPVAHAWPAERYRPWPPYLLFLSDLARYGIGAVSISHRDYTASLSRGLGPLVRLVYTVNEPAELSRVEKLGANVVLTDRLSPESRR